MLEHLKVSPHGSFQVTRLCESVAICEATNGDRHDWGNATDTEPAFTAYLGCKRDEVAGYVKTFNTPPLSPPTGGGWGGCEVRKPRHLKEFEAEIKIRGMKRRSNSDAFGLDYLIESESAKHFGADYDEYNYYATGYMPRW
jgi:hypothetical protein